MAMRFLQHFAVVAAIVFSIWFLGDYVLPTILPFIFGGIVAQLLRPMTLTLKKGSILGYKTSAILAIFIFYSATLLLVWNIGFLIFAQTVSLFTRLPDDYISSILPSDTALWGSINSVVYRYLPFLKPYTQSLFTEFNEFTHNLLSTVSAQVLDGAAVLVQALPDILISTGLGFLSSAFILMDYDRIRKFILSLFPQSIKKLLCYSAGFVFDTGKKIVKAYLILWVLTFAQSTIGLWLLGIEFFATAGMFVALVDILPVLGSGLVLVPWGIITIINGSTAQGVGILILYAIMSIIRTIIEPKIVGERIGLHPLATIISLYVGARLFGFLGLIFAPILVTLVAHLYSNGKLQEIRYIRRE